MQLRYFAEGEFRGQYDKMNKELLNVIDQFRHVWGLPVVVSNSDAALGRTYGNGYHNYVKHGSIKAIDLIPQGMVTPEDFKSAVEIAEKAGAGGIGIYPMWNQGPGIHIDVGPEGRRWSAFPTGENGKQEYYAIEKAWEDD